MPEHRGCARKHAGQVRDVDRRNERRHESLRSVDDDDGQPERPAVDAPHVGAADVPAPEAADVGVLDRADEPITRRDRPGEVPADNRERSAYF
jgi:hypothetical protein